MMARRFFALVIGLAVALSAAGMVQAQEKAEKKEKKWHKKGPRFKALGKNVTLEFKAEGQDDTLISRISTASNKYELRVERANEHTLACEGIVTVDEKGGYLVSFNLQVQLLMRLDKKFTNKSLFIKGSALLKNGQEVTIGKSDDYILRLKLTE